MAGVVPVKASLSLQTRSNMRNARGSYLRVSGSTDVHPRSRAFQGRARVQTCAVDCSIDNGSVRLQEWQELRQRYGKARLSDSTAQQFNTVVGRIASLTHPSKMEKAAAGEAMKAIQQALQKDHLLKVEQCLAGGSHGKRTSVLGKFDMDVLALVSDGTPFGESAEKCLQRMRHQVVRVFRRASVGSVRFAFRDADLRSLYGRQVLQMEVTGLKGMGSRSLDVDLLLLPNYTAGIPVGACPAWWQHVVVMAPLYEQLEDTPGSVVFDQSRGRADSLSSVEYLKRVPGNVKDIVRLLKAWYKYALRERIPFVSSVLLETVVLAAWQQWRQRLPVALEVRTSGEMRQKALLLVESLALLEAAVLGDRTVVVNAESWGYPRELGLACEHIWGEHPVRVIHPVDPTCNLAAPRGQHVPDPNWAALAQEAHLLRCSLETRTFAEVCEETTLGEAMTRMLSGAVGGGAAV